MGGYGSGSWRASRYGLVNRSYAIGLEWTRRVPALQRDEHLRGEIAWSDGESRLAEVGWAAYLPPGTEGWTADPHFTLTYRVRSKDEAPRPIKQRFHLVATQPHYGGLRWFIVCVCGRRVAKLYLPFGRCGFRCRHCRQLRYRSQRLTVDGRWRHRANKIATRLGGEAADGLVYKPKRMRWATFDRLMDDVQTYNDAAFGYRVRGLLKPNSWLSRALRR
jgi:hypothetical protein